MKKTVILRLVGLSVLSIGLTGCYYAIPTVVEAVNQNRIEQASQGNIAQSKTGPIKLDISAQTPDKVTFNCCVLGYNSVMTGELGLFPSYKLLISQTFKPKKHASIVFPKINGIESAIYYLEKSAQLDAKLGLQSDRTQAVSSALTALKKLHMDEKSSLPYFRNELYKRDGMLGAQQMLPIIRLDYENAINAMEQLGQLLFEQQLSYSETRIQYHFDRQESIFYHIENSLYLAQRSVALFSASSSSDQKPDNAQIDGSMLKMSREVKVLEKLMDQTDQHWQGAVAIKNNLLMMYSLYLQYRGDRSIKTYNKMMTQYAHGIESYNASMASQAIYQTKLAIQ